VYKSTLIAAAVAAALTLATTAPAHAASERQELEELRNTVVNLLQGLVERGVISQEQARQMVSRAQEKASAEAEATAAADEGAVRVPYVPQIVKDEIAKQVAETVRPAVVDDVVGRAKSERWGVPAALPDWLSRVRVSGDVRLRLEQQLFANGNAEDFYLDFGQINARGGLARAGTAALLNVTEDRFRMRARARLGFAADLGSGWKAGLRFVTGALQDAGSPNQTLGNEFSKFSFNLDQAYIRYDAGRSSESPSVSVVGGRFASPWFTPTQLVVDDDITFEGVAVTGRLPVGFLGGSGSNVYLTLGAMPVQEVALTARDKWLYGAQLGTELRFDDRHVLRAGAAYYDFRNVAGRRNSFESTLLDYTAPPFLRIGNSLFDIRNSADLTSNLYALASAFEIANVAVSYEVPIGSYSLLLVADAAKNLGFDRNEIRARTGLDIEERTDAYQFEVGFGHPRVAALGAWRATLGYRYVERDSVLDAITDSNPRAGGTDQKGFFFRGSFGLSARSSIALRYFSFDEIDGVLYPFGVQGQRFRFGLDTVQVDFNAQF
jgi:polyhydroxyalkanoate synthesis regulator phasin